MRDGEDPVKEAIQGKEVAVAIDDVTVGRQINPGDVIYVNLMASSIKELQSAELSEDERMTLEETISLRRRSEPFWGM
jgi:translation initiation factor 5B